MYNVATVVAVGLFDPRAVHRTLHFAYRAAPRYTSSQGVGFEFEDLKSDAAVEIGVIIGKHQQQ